MLWASATCWIGRRVLVTGGSGFLGGALCRHLLELGAQVWATGLCRLPPEGVVALRARLPDDAEEVVRMSRPEVVFHLASPISMDRDPGLYPRLREGILDATDAVARACLAQGARLVHVGTCEEYGTCTAPFRETDAPQPVSAYSALKAGATAWVLALAQTSGLQATVVRPFRTYGPGDATSVIAAACRAALARQPFPMTDGAQIREWNHVDAITPGLIAAGAHPDAPGQVLNLGGGPRESVRAVVARAFALAGADPALVQVGALPRRAGEVEAFYADTSRAEALWGPLPHVPLDDGLIDTLDWMVAEGEL